MKWCNALNLATAFNHSRLVPTDLGHSVLVLHCSYLVLGTWCRPMFAQRVFKASPPQFKSSAFSGPCPRSKNSLYACTVWALPLRCLCAALILHARCLCATCTLHCAAMRAPCAPPCALPMRCRARCLWAAKHASVRCHARLRALPCALPCAAMRATMLPIVGNMHVFAPVSRVPTASACPTVPPRPRRGAPMA